MSTNSFDEWETFLNPDKLKQNLIKASIFLSAYEVLKSRVIDDIKEFYAFGWELNEQTGEVASKVSEEYKSKVLALYPRDEFHACCLWLLEVHALSQEDLDVIVKIRKHRNVIAHEMTKFLSSPKDNFVDHQLLITLLEIVKKIDQWWFREVEVPTNPDFKEEDLENIDWDNVMGLGTMTLMLMISLFDGDDTYLTEIHKGFVAEWKRNNAK